MIARLWHGRTNLSKADAYFEYTKRAHLPAYESVAGNLGVYLLRRVEGNMEHFLVLSLWESMDALHRFSGPDETHPHYLKEDKDFLTEFEPVVHHYEVHAAGIGGLLGALAS